MSDLSLGVDVGTTGVKAVLLDPSGSVRAEAFSHHGISRRAGVVEVNPSTWWSSTCRALGQLGGSLGAVGAVGVSGNMSSVVLLDSELEPVGDAPLLADTRGSRQIARRPEELAERITARTMNRPAAVFSLATLLWLRDQPDAPLRRARSWVSAKDYIRLRLTGTVGTDVTDAYNSLLIDARERQWNEALIAELGLPRGVFPVVEPSDSVIGEVVDEAASQTGLTAGVPVVTGAGDMAAAAIGAGGLRPGTLLVSLGTSATALAGLDTPELAPDWQGKLTYHPLPSDGHGFALASLLTGGLAVNWLRDLLGKGALIAPLPAPDPDDPLVFLPHLAGSGTPDFNTHMHGTVWGVRPSTTGPQIAQALFEAIAFELADIVALVGDDTVRSVQLTGGGARLSSWVQVITDVLGLPTEVLGQPDVSAIGAAVLAGRAAWGAGDEVRPQPVARMVPDRRHEDDWRRRRARYRAARAAAVAYYDDISERMEARQ
jgi:xylulokinase